MTGISLHTIKAKQNKWWMKMHLVFSMLVVSQFFTFHHQIEHLTDYTEVVCDQCLVSADYFDSSEKNIESNIALSDTSYVFNLDQSISQTTPSYYSSRAPPFQS